MTAKEAAKRFEDKRKNCRTLHLLYLLGLMVVVIILLVWGTKPAIFACAPLLVWYFTVVRASVKKYAADWREFCVRLFCEKHFGKVEYSYKADAASLPLYVQHPLAVKSSKGSLLARNLATGSHAGIDATFLDSTLPIGEGRAIRFLSGCWMGMSFDSLISEPVRVLKDDTLEPGEGFKPCQAPEGMPEDCTFHTESGTLELPEDCIPALKALLESMFYDGAVELRPEGLFVFLPQRLLNKRPPALKYAVTEAMIGRLAFPEIDAAYMLALKLRK